MTGSLPLSGEPAHVVHVIGALNTGGAEKMLLNFLGAVDRARYRHTIVCLTARGDMAAEAEAMGVPVVLFPVRMRRLPLDVARFADWMRREDVRIVHSHMYFASFWSRLAALRAGVPVLITTEHGKEPWKTWWQSRIDRFLSRRTHHHIAVSDDIRNIRIERDGIDPARITLIPNGVPIPNLKGAEQLRAELRTELGLASDEKVIGSVGRVIHAKAYPDLLAAFVLARRLVPGLRWLQIGDGPDLADL
ncbi:glycosyltransferase, partial [bacterium]|nr:glycosyltransferase [bacterium]